MRLFSVVLLFALASAELLQYHDAKYHPNFVKLGSAHGKRVNITFTLRIPVERQEAFKTHLDQISDPHHPLYGQWMSVEEVSRMMRPVAGSKSKVANWIRSSLAGTFEEGKGKDFQLGFHSDRVVLLNCRVEAVEQLFHTQMAVYQHRPTQQQLIRASAASWVPSELMEDAVQLVIGLSDTFVNRHFSHQMAHNNGKKVMMTSTGSAAINSMVVAGNLRDLYEIPAGNRIVRNSTTSVGFYANSDEGGKYEYADLYSFIKQIGLPSTDNISMIHGNYRAQHHDMNYDGEVVLDGETLMSMAPNAQIWFWIEPRWMYEFAADIAEDPQTPDVLSVSYGFGEVDQCTIQDSHGKSACHTGGTVYTNQQYVEATNLNFMKAAARGITIVCADGDSGACTDGPDTLVATFPGSSPYVVSVGSTMMYAGSSPQCQKSPIRKVTQPSPASPLCSTKGANCADLTQPFCEVALSGTTMHLPDMSDWSTGGGFSSYFDRPSWQDESVEGYLSSSAVMPNKAHFNASKRGFPDVATLGHQMYTYTVDQGKAIFDGTSFSAPLFAGMVTLLNDQLAEWGKPKLGYLNPLLYQMAHDDDTTFYDVVFGDDNLKCKESYGCAVGWDPVSGLGVPRFGNILGYLENMQ